MNLQFDAVDRLFNLDGCCKKIHEIFESYCWNQQQQIHVTYASSAYLEITNVVDPCGIIKRIFCISIIIYLYVGDTVIFSLV